MHKFIIIPAVILGLTTSPARAEPKQVKGSEFVTTMNGNTLQATNKDGVQFKAFFRNGGLATYEDEKGGRDQGTWRIKDGSEVCVTWKRIADGKERCARVYLDAGALIWKGENVSGEGRLLGGVR